MRTMINNMYRELTPDEITEFKQWARDNFKPGDPINNVWHDVVIEECELIKMEARVIEALNNTWNAIGMDSLQVIIEFENRSYMTKEEVIEVVTDADRLHYNGNDKEAAEYFYSLEYGGPERRELLDKTFKEDKYGM
jgi:hypothetical protein